MRILNKVVHWKTVLLYGFFVGQLFFSVTLSYAQDTENSAVDSDNTSKILATTSSEVANNKDNEQTGSDNKKENRYVYIGFVYPLGADWIDSIKYRYILSLSLLGNITGGTTGIALSPLFNAAFGDSYGLHMAAVANITGGDFTGFQSAVANVTTGTLKGVSLGVINIITNGTAGVALSPLFNAVFGNSYGLHMTAVVNITGGDFTGFQSAVANVTTGTLKGVSLGIINIITKDSPNAVPIGLLNIVVGGKFQLGIAASTVFPSGALVYRMGAKHFYMIYSAAPSVSYANDSVSYTGYAVGLGMGFDIPIHKRMALLAEIEGIPLNISYGTKESFSSVVQLRPLIEFRIVKQISLIVGPTVNFYFKIKNKNSNYKPLWDMPIPNTDYNTWSFGAGGYVGLAYTF